MRLACSSKLAPGDSIREKLANLERFGFEGVEFRLTEEEATPERIAEAEEALAESPLTVCCVSMPGAAGGLPLDSEDAKRTKLAYTKTILQVAARLGGPMIITPEYRPQFPLPLWDRPKPLTAKENELLLSFVSEVAEFAEKVSGIAMLEPINRYEGHFYNRVEEALAVCKKVGSDRIKLMIDFFHMSIEERDIAASIEQAAGYVQHVQLGDNNRELPGQGSTDFRTGFAALRRIGYDGYMALECRIPDEPEREIPECVRYLRKCVADSAIV
jgi:sugar phosphate isomerase/epimerase